MTKGEAMYIAVVVSTARDTMPLVICNSVHYLRK